MLLLILIGFPDRNINFLNTKSFSGKSNTYIITAITRQCELVGQFAGLYRRF